jgi:hypothetical protein
MKIHLLSLALVFGVAGALLSPARLQAQDAGAGRRLAFLSADDRAHFLKVREQVLASNPDLKTEQESLMKEREYMKGQGTSASADDRKTFRENFMAHTEKMNAAMLKADPTISPVLDQIKEKMKERFEQHAAQTGGGTAGT